MQALLPAIREWFSAKSEHLAIFAAADCRLEGWFKGELLVLFSELQHRGVIEGFEREAFMPSHVPGARLQIDFKVHLEGVEHLCELKALCISQAAGTPRNLSFYFRDDHLGIIKDIRKLDALHHPNRWLMAFVYPAPTPAKWNVAVRSLPTEIRHWRPLEAPDERLPLFVSLWTPESVVAAT